jgi:ABC-type branched-subunit amino acid transport system ATPase component
VLFGKNGAGKSLLMRGLRDQQKGTYHYVSPERAGNIEFNANYMQQELSPHTRSSRNSVNLSPTYREAVISRIQAFLAKRGNIREGYIIENPLEIESMLQSLLPEFVFQIKDGSPPFSFTRVLDDQEISSVNHLSSGESQVLTLALDILLICAMWRLEGLKQGVLLIDEPDCHLHPDLLQHLAKFFVDVVEKYSVQMIVATHSTPLLSAIGHYGDTKTSIVYINNAMPEQRASRFTDTLQELATCLGGHALMGPLFGAPLLLVEGDDDYVIWSQVPRHGIIKLAVIPCAGSKIDQYRRSLENIFASLLSQRTTPSAYVLKDGDKPNTTSGFTHVKCLNLVCHESENLYLTDEVLASFGYTWETAKTKIKEQSGEYGNKSTMLSDVDSWDRKFADIKRVIKEIAAILDEKHVLWSVRVGKCIGEKRPNGQLAEFLGNALVTALWEPTGSTDS